MKKIYALLSLCLLFVTANSQTVYNDYVDGKVYFKIKKETRTFRSLDGDYRNLPINTMPFLTKLQKSAGITRLEQPFVHAKKSDELKRIYRLEFTNIAQVETIIQQLVATGEVEYAEKVPLTKTTLTVDDPSYSSQWGLATINAPMAWSYFSTGSTIVVAIVDDAIDRPHPDLSPNIWVNPGDPTVNGVDDDGNGYVDDINGWDVADNDNNPNPTTTSFDHGTHVSGIVGARSNNTTGVASIGFSVKLMCVKSTNSATSVTNGYDGVLYAADNGARVINMSWGGTGSSVSTQAIIDYAFGQGCVLVAAAGNNNVSTMFYPAAYTNVIAVAATTSSDTKASFSNYGSWVDISAPGFNIYSTFLVSLGSYGNKSGTSMASPMVAGLAGLMLSLNPALTNVDIRNCLTSTAVNIDALNPGYGGMLGAGRIDANAAMSCVSSTLSWPPVADFVANVTTVTAGGSVNYTDLSVYLPTSWTWSFPGGTPSSHVGPTPPPITYSTPGTYNAQLTVSNVNGTDVELKNLYITVNPAGGCAKLNYPVPATWHSVNYYTGASVGADGWINGVNLYGDKEKAAYFDASSTPYTYLDNVWIAFGLAYSSVPAKIVPVKIYDGTSGSPGSLLGTSNLTMGKIMSDVAGNYYTEATFVPTPVSLPASKKFFVSIDVTNLNWSTSHDTLSIVSNTNGETVPSAIWDKNSTSTWQQYGTGTTWNLNASLIVHPWLTSEPANATFTNSSLTICEDNSVSFNGTGSTFEDTLLWYFPGGTPNLSNNLTETVMYNTPGSYLATLYVVGGGCDLLDSMFVTVTVNAKPSVSVSASVPAICPAGSSTLTASGGSVSYAWTPTTGLSSGSGAVVTATPASTTSYTVTGTSASGCTNSSVIEIDVLSPPTATATVGTTLCTGSPVSFDGSLSADATSFSWTLTGGTPSSSTGTGGTTSYSAPGTYNVQLQVTNICGTDTDIVPITVNASPTASFSFTMDTVCTTNGLVAMSGTPAGGAFTGSGVSGSNFDPSTGAGTYTVTYTYTDVNSCMGTASDNIVVEVCSAIAEALNNGTIAVFPNPASTALNILGKVNFDRVQLTDMTGRIVLSNQFTTTNIKTIDLNNLPNGVYNIALLSSTNIVYANRIVVSK